jgi:type II secretory pathway pseudopilin PulG
MFSHSDVTPARGFSRNEGFTILEILMATVIMLIAFSGIMSLMIATTYMNIRAKERASVVNEANSYIERVRQMNYDDIGTTTSTPPGILAAYTTTVNGYQISVSPSVIAYTDPKIVTPGFMKKLTVSITARTGTADTAPMHYATEAIIKKTDTGVNSLAQLPFVDKDSTTPGEGTPVRGQSVHIGANASAIGSGVTLTSMNFYCDGVPLKDSFGNTAQWSLSSTDANKTFDWDTTAKNADGVPLSVDGVHTMKVEVWDSNGKQTWVQWTVVVDNSPPLWPSGDLITGTPVNSTVMNLAWSTAYDGNSPSYAYRIRAQRDDGTGLAAGSWPASATLDVLGTTYPATPYPFPTNAFSRYYFYVTAVGPPTVSSESTSGASTTAISRSDISGSTWANVGTNKLITSYVTIKISHPTFSYSAASVTNTLYKSTSRSMASPSIVGATFTSWTPPQFTVGIVSGNGWPSAPAYYYQVKTVITPTGGEQATVYSQILGPGGTSGGNGTLATAGW